MTHLDEGRLLAVRDEELHDLHLSECASCREALEEARARGGVVSRALATLESPTDLEAARAIVRERVAVQAARNSGAIPLRPRRAQVLWSASKVAGLLMITAAGLSALPGSPVRTWIAGLVERSGPEGRAGPATPSSLTVGAEATGIRLAVASGPLRVVVVGAEPGAELRVRWVPGADAAVFAPVGSRFTSGEGRIEARVVSGTVRIELPRGVVSVSLEVGGRIYLRTTDAGLDVPGPMVERTDSEIVFRIP